MVKKKLKKKTVKTLLRGYELVLQGKKNNNTFETRFLLRNQRDKSYEFRNEAGLKSVIMNFSF